MATMAAAALSGTITKDDMKMIKKPKVHDSTSEHVNYAERRQMGTSSRCLDVDQRINSMLRRKVQLPSLNREQVHSGENGSHILQPKANSNYVDIELGRLGPKRYHPNPVDSDVYSVAQGRKSKVSSSLTIDDTEKYLVSNRKSRLSSVVPKTLAESSDFVPSRASMSQAISSSKTRVDLYSVPQVSQLLTTGANSSAQVHRGANSVRGIAHAVSAPFKGLRIPGLAYAVAPDEAFPTFLGLTPDNVEDAISAKSGFRVITSTATGNGIHSTSLSTMVMTSDDLDMKARIDNLMMRTTDTSRLMHEAREMATAETQAEPTLNLPTMPMQKSIESLRIDTHHHPVDRHCDPRDMMLVTENSHRMALSPPPYQPSVCPVYNTAGEPMHASSVLPQSKKTRNELWLSRATANDGCRDTLSPDKHTSTTNLTQEKHLHKSDFDHDFLCHKRQSRGNLDDRLHDSRHFGGGYGPTSQLVDHSHDDDTMQKQLPSDAAAHVGPPSAFDFLRQATASESTAGSLVATAKATSRVRGASNNSPKDYSEHSHEGPSDRYIKNEHTFSPLPSLEQVLDYIDEMASPLLPGMDIKSSQLGRQHLSIDDALGADTEVECSNREAILVFMDDNRPLSPLPCLEEVELNPCTHTINTKNSFESRDEMRSSFEDQILENTIRDKDYEEGIVKEIRHDFCLANGHSETLHSMFHVEESTQVTVDPLENTMADVYYESEFDDSPLPNGIPSFVLARVKRSESNRSHHFPISNEAASFYVTAETCSERDRIFVHHPNVSIFGDTDEDLVDATNLNVSMGKKLYSWMCCGSAELAPVADGIQFLGSNSDQPNRANVAAMTSERPILIDAHQPVGNRFSLKPREVDSRAGQIADDVIDTIIVVGQSSNASSFGLDDVGDMQTREYIRDGYVRPMVMDDKGNDWSGRYDEVMTHLQEDGNGENGQTQNLNGLISCTVDERDEASVFHDSLEEDVARDKCTIEPEVNYTVLVPIRSSSPEYDGDTLDL